MKELYFKCELLTNVVLNSKMATEGNMTTLDYISGSNFLGIVAGKLYKQIELEEKSYSLFHNGDVSFGDAYISVDENESYHLPASLFTDKLYKDLEKDDVWVHHEIDFDNGKEPRDDNQNRIQLKQVRAGYFNLKNTLMPNIKKGFTLKSAYDANKRRADDGKMFGYEYLKKEQSFIFSVRLKDDSLEKEIKDSLIGECRLGKSKTAEFGQVKISEIKGLIDKPESIKKEGYVIVYANSNLCILNEYGQSTFQPKPSDFGIEDKAAQIIWGKSQIRTYSYSPWNGQRDTTNTQRDCILKGSVFYIETSKEQQLDNLISIGEYTAEGLGRVIFNPKFLEASNDGKGLSCFKLTKFEATPEAGQKVQNEIKTDLIKFLKKQMSKKKEELQISKDVQTEFEKSIDGLKKFISASQWGSIRDFAIKATSFDELEQNLFTNDKAFLKKGVAAEKYWNPANGKLRDELQKIFKRNESLDFVIKYTSLMAKNASKP